MPDLIPLGGLWKNTSATSGDSYLQGKLSPTIRILIFKNKFKTADNQPDFQIYLAPVPKPEASRTGQGKPGDGAASPARGGTFARRTPEPPAGDFGDMEDPFAD
jgi:hypothetical protein